MKTDTSSIFGLFQVHRRHVVPLFQRQYVWEENDHWEPLWEDLRKKADEQLSGAAARPHFLGAIVLNQLMIQTRQVDTREIIDGQQRLTTLQLYLAAFRDLIPEDEKRLVQQLDLLTVNHQLADDPDQRFKVWPTQADQQIFSEVMAARSAERVRGAFDGAECPRLAEAYLFFSDKLSNYLREDDAGVDSEKLWALYDCLRERLVVVVIDLEEGDDPQIIFETLNARGVPLLPSDLIRNYLLHQAQSEGFDIEPLYNRWWRNFDQDLAEDAQSEDDFFWKREQRQGRLTRPRLDLFFFHYLHFESAEEVSIGQLFREFCQWRQATDRDVETILSRLQANSDVFRTFLVPESGGGEPRTKVFLRRLLTLDTSTLYALLLELLGPDGLNVDLEGRLLILNDLESFLVRRMVCRLTIKNYNRFFLSLLKQVRGSSEAPEAVIRERLLGSEEHTARWPNDQEFQAAWLERPAYKDLRNDRIQMVLGAIERRLFDESNAEVLRLDQVTSIEHVMPRSWNAHWQLERPTEVIDGATETRSQRRDRLVNSFGNLTLLTQSLNSSMSNSPYENKRPEITRQSGLRLNTYFQHVDHWNEDEILRRGEALFRIATEVWPHP